MAESRKLTDEELNEIDQAFNMFDKDGSGSIDINEIRTAMVFMGMSPTDEDINTLMNEIDENGDGTVDKEEFRTLMATYYKDPVTEEEEIREAFKVFDKDGNGTIDKRELYYVLCNVGPSKLSEQELEDIFSQVDTNEDGVISYEEFVKAMTEKCL